MTHILVYYSWFETIVLNFVCDSKMRQQMVL